jgi:hypothetical protein
MLNEESNLKCSQVISSHIGWKLKYCGKWYWQWCLSWPHRKSAVTLATVYTHLKNGTPVKSHIKYHPCPAEHTIFVPTDHHQHVAIVVLHHTRPHNHPIPPMIKAWFNAKAAYQKCVTQTGIPTATAKKVDVCTFNSFCCC